MFEIIVVQINQQIISTNTTQQIYCLNKYQQIISTNTLFCQINFLRLWIENCSNNINKRKNTLFFVLHDLHA